MSPAEILALRQSLKMNSKQFAEALGYKSGNPYQLVKRWEDGTREPSPQAIMVMEIMRDEHIAKSKS